MDEEEDDSDSFQEIEKTDDLIFEEQSIPVSWTKFSPEEEPLALDDSYSANPKIHSSVIQPPTAHVRSPSNSSIASRGSFRSLRSGHSARSNSTSGQSTA